MLDIDNPEYGPSTFFSPDGVQVTTTTTTPTPLFTVLSPGSGGKSSSAGAIAGGVVGGIAAISIAVAVILYLRGRRSRVVSAGVDASQPVLNDGMVTQSSTGSPLTMKFYVCVFVPHGAALVCPRVPFLTISMHLGPRLSNYISRVPR